MQKLESTHQESRLLTSVLARLQESYLRTPSPAPSSPLILIYLNNNFTDGIYWVQTRLNGHLQLTNATAYRLPCWDVELTDNGLVLEALEAQFASSKLVGIGLLTQIDHNPRVRETVARIKWTKAQESANTVEKVEMSEKTEEYVFPQYALDYLMHVYKLAR